MPNLTEVMHSVGRARWITVCDATPGYWQLDVKEEDRWLAAFVTHNGFGNGSECRLALSCAGNTFVRNVLLCIAHKDV